MCVFLPNFISVLSHLKLHRGERGDLSWPYWKSKKVSWFWKERSWLLPSLDLWVKFFMYIVVLRVSREKSSKMFPCGVSFSFVSDEMFFEVPSSINPSLWKISGHAPAVKHYYFCKRFHLKWLKVFWIRLCLDKCSVVCTVTYIYVLHKTNSELWHTQHSDFSGICRHIQSYLALLRHIHTCWDIINTYSGLFRHIQHPV